ncbi:MAG: PspC domain-containing protein [Gordonia sp.]|nr:PspC domain-containing protein [Gordonia sp. (in: high G+C Gram-positive bacteria)]
MTESQFPTIPYSDGALPTDLSPAPISPAPQPKRLTRSTNDRMLGGVAGGLAEYFGVSSTLVRVAFVASLLLPGPQVLLYLLLWIVIPQE